MLHCCRSYSSVLLKAPFSCAFADPLADPSTAGSSRSVSCLPRTDRGVITIDLQPGYAQARHTMGLDRALPGGELLDRELIATAGFLETNGASADGVDDHRLAARHPALGVRRRQVDDGAVDARPDLVSSRIGVGSLPTRHRLRKVTDRNVVFAPSPRSPRQPGPPPPRPPKRKQNQSGRRASPACGTAARFIYSAPPRSRRFGETDASVTAA